MIHRDSWIHVVNDQPHDKSIKLIIREGAGIGMGATISAAKRVVIGRNALFARNVYISDHRHAYENIHTPIENQGICGVQEVEIGDETWIGQNACVLPGVKIGRHCVIGANSVVTRSIPDYTVAVGAPAIPVKQYDPVLKTWRKCPADELANISGCPDHIS
jgi:acetyltransferase-like isoleucine patch superfamily enzyme